MKFSPQSFFVHFSLKTDRSITVTMLITVVYVVSFGDYQIGNVEAQLTNTSSVSELIDNGNSLANLGKYKEAISYF